LQHSWHSCGYQGLLRCLVATCSNHFQFIRRSREGNEKRTKMMSNMSPAWTGRSSQKVSAAALSRSVP
jgi:hypothetical protein